MSQIVLPACVETREDGSIVVRGHRVSLYLILQAHYEGLAVDGIHERYPSIPLSSIREIADYCRDNGEMMRQFFAEQVADHQRVAETVETPDLRDLRHRKA